MSTFVLNITNICNQKCVFCLDGDLKKTFLYLSTEESKEKIREAQRDGFSIVIFMGGETVLRKDFPELVSYVSSSGMIPWVATNGMRFADKKYLQGLVDAGLGGIEMSFHSHRKETAFQLTGVEATKEKQVKALANIIKIHKTDSKLKLIFNIVINSWNYREVENTVRFLRRQFKGDFFAEIKFKAMRPVGRAAGNRDIVPRFHEVAPYLYEGLQYAGNNGMKYDVEMFPLCCVPGHEECVLETRDIVLSKKYSGWNFHSGAHVGLCENNNYDKPIKCGVCRLNEICAGVWKGYLQLFGDSEMAPVSKDPADIINKVLIKNNSKG